MRLRPAGATLLGLLFLAAADARGQEGPPSPRLMAQLEPGWIVTIVAISGDERYVATASDGGSVLVWDVETGLQIVRLEGHEGGVSDLAFAPDGSFILTGSEDGNARILETISGREKLRIAHPPGVLSVAVSPDGRLFATGGEDGMARIWSAETGREVGRLAGHGAAVTAVSFSPEGERVATGSRDFSARVWDLATGEEIRRFPDHPEWVSGALLLPGGRLLTGCWDGIARLFDVATGEERARAGEGYPGPVRIAVDAAGRRALVGEARNRIRLWDLASGEIVRSVPSLLEGCGDLSRSGEHVLRREERAVILEAFATGREVRRFESTVKPLNRCVLSRDGRWLATGAISGVAEIWDLASGRLATTIPGDGASLETVDLSPDSRWLLTGDGEGRVQLYEAATGRRVRSLLGHTGVVNAAAFSPSGERLLACAADGTVRIWDAETGKQRLRIAVSAYSVAWSHDGRYVLSGGPDHSARLWDAESGREARRFYGHEAQVCTVAFSPDDRWILTGAEDRAVILWDAATGAEIRRLEPVPDPWSVAFSPDGVHALSAGEGEVRLWDLGTGEEQAHFTGHLDGINAIAFTPDGGRVVTSSRDGTVRVWERATGREICRLTAFRDGTFAVADPAGRYDASNGGDVVGLHWVLGGEPVSLDQLKERYYDPGLLGKLLGFSEEPLREVGSLSAPALHPRVRVTPAGGGPGRFRIDLENRGGGIGRVVVLVNGKEVTADARGGGVDAGAARSTIEIDLSGDARVLPGGDNAIEVFAFNAEGYLRSRGLRVPFTAPTAEDGPPPELWAVVAGISDYRGEAIDLRFAAKDATDFASALRLAAVRLFGEDRVHLALLTTGSDPRPDRENLAAALHGARAARPGDVFLLYLAGHGVSTGGEEGDFHFLTADAASADLSDPEVRGRVALSSGDLTALLNRIPALKQVLILDTCASGRLVEKLTEKREVPGSQVRAMERLKDRTGVHVLAGCAADQVSYEATRYGQGLLTHSLLLGMKGAALRQEEYVDVLRLFTFSSDRVPDLARDIGGVQRPMVAIPRGGGSFDLGRLLEADRARIPLEAARPLVLRSSFQDEDEYRDVLGLAKLVDDRLAEISSRGGEAPLVFVDARDLPEAFVVAGRYRVSGEKISVTARVFRGKEALATLEAEGRRDALEDLAARLVDEARRKME